MAPDSSSPTPPSAAPSPPRRAPVTVVASVWEATGADCIVNPVNTVGVMGAGLAKAIADRYPAILAPYRAVCASGQLQPGGVWLWRPDAPDGTGAATPAICCLATKQHWRAPSDLGWVAQGLAQLAALLQETPDLRHLAVPALGCGHGGLSWDTVAPLVRQLVRQFPDRQWSIAPPVVSVAPPAQLPRARRRP